MLSNIDMDFNIVTCEWLNLKALSLAWQYYNYGGWTIYNDLITMH